MAAFVGPLFIDWNGYRAAFESRASDLLGQPVTIAGDIDFVLLPTPRISADNVEIGVTEAGAAMRIEHVSMRLELFAFLSGRMAISELALDRPQGAVAIDAEGRPVGLPLRAADHPLEPGQLTIADVSITNGSLAFRDVRSGTELELTGITTERFEMTAIEGPWRINGTLNCRGIAVCGDGTPVTFGIATGRPEPEGTRLSIELVPADADVAGTLTTDGRLSNGEGGLVYDGNFRFERLGTAVTETPDAPGNDLVPTWTLGGRFNLDVARLTLSDLLYDPGRGSTTLSGTATVFFGDGARFEADLTTRPIDLDTLIGRGPAEPIHVADAADQLLGYLRDFELPAIPGHARIVVPAVIVSGSSLQNLSLELVAAADHLEITALSVGLPGQTTLTASGIVTTAEAFGFAGEVALSSNQPAALAAWWRGTEATGLVLQPFAVTATGQISEAEVNLERFALSIGTSEAAGTVAWRFGESEEGPRTLAANVTAGRLDLDRTIALGELIFGPGLTDTAGLADEYVVRLDADEIVIGELALREVAIDAMATASAVTINAATIGDLGGGRVAISSGRLEFGATPPRGSLTARLEADAFDGVVAVVRRLAPGAAFADWLERVGPTLAPADLAATVEAPGPTGADIGIELTGTAGGTTLRAELGLRGPVEEWFAGRAELALEMDAADAVIFARQTGWAAAETAGAGPVTVDLTANGVPENGMELHFQANFAGLSLFSDGTLTLDRSWNTGFDGRVSVRGDLGPALAMAALTLPGAEDGVPAVLEAVLDANADGLGLVINRSSIDAQAVEGNLRLAQDDTGRTLTGDLDLEALDLGLLIALAAGIDPLPTGDPAEPWPRSAFTGSVLGDLSAEIAITASRLVAGGLDLGNAALALSLGPDGGAINLASAGLAGGDVRGNLAIALEGEVATATGQLVATAVPLASFVWRSDGQPVAEGTFDFTMQFRGSGRSPAGLVAGLTGDGTAQIRDAAFHFMNAEAFEQTVRMVDDGATLDEAGLRTAFTGFLDTGELTVPVVDTAFDIAGGVLTPRVIFVEGIDATTVARAQIDLGRLTIDSSWEFTLRQPADAGLGPPPSVFITFAGPITAPVREINVTPLAGYLSLRSLRQADRLQNEVLEREFFIRMIERIDADRIARLRVGPPPVAAQPAPAAPPPAADPVGTPVPLPAGPVPPLRIPPG